MNFCGGELGFVIRDGSSSFYSFSFQLVTYLLCYVFIHISHFVIDLHSIDEIIICIIVTEQLLSSLKTGTC